MIGSTMHEISALYASVTGCVSKSFLLRTAAFPLNLSSLPCSISPKSHDFQTNIKCQDNPHLTYQYLSEACPGILEISLWNTSHIQYTLITFSTALASCTLTACLKSPVAMTIPRTLSTNTPLQYKEGHLYVYKALVLSTTRGRLLVNEYIVPRLPIVDRGYRCVVSFTHRLHYCVDVWSALRTGCTTVQICGQLYALHRLHYSVGMWSALRTGCTTVQMCGQVYARHRLHYSVHMWSALRTGCITVQMRGQLYAPAVLLCRCVVRFTHFTGCTTLQVCGQLYEPAALLCSCVVSFTHRLHYCVDVWSVSLTNQSTVPTRYRQQFHTNHFNLYTIQTSLCTLHSVNIHRCVNFKYHNSKTKKAENVTRM